MIGSPPVSPWQAGGREVPFIIGHRGNSPDTIAEFVRTGADFVEIDLWVHKGRFESRHERALYPLPLLFERWYLTLRAGRFDLAATPPLLEGRARLFLDLKNGGEAVIPLILDTFAAYPELQLSASSADWPTLRCLYDAVPGVDVFYSIEVPERLDLFLSVIERDGRPAGVSCRATLLSQDLVNHLHSLGLCVVAWTVDDLALATRLAGWGVDAITTHRVDDVRATLTE